MRAGDVLCEVETDKSTVGFEVQEDFVLAKRLFPEGAGDISVGTSIAIGVRKVEFVDGRVGGALTKVVKGEEKAGTVLKM